MFRVRYINFTRFQMRGDIMANKNLFKSAQNPSVPAPVAPPTNVVNKAGGNAYKMEDKHALAQLAATGCFGSTFYIDEAAQLEAAKKLAASVDPEFVAKVAVYAREKGYMKDMPAFLAASLAKRDVELLKKVFSRVVDDGKMLRNFVQIIRSGVTGRKSLGSVPKKLINKWISSQRDETLFRASVGNSPSLADVIKMTHPSPNEVALPISEVTCKKDEAKFAIAKASRAALYGYLTGKEAAGPGKPAYEEKRDPRTGKTVVIHRYNAENLPDCVKQYENFKKTKSGEVPNVDFRLLTALDLTRDQWVQIARNAPWHMARMNLNTFQRHGVFDVPGMDQVIAQKLADPVTIAKVKVFPYQLLAAYLNTTGLPARVTNALQDAMELATNNIPAIDGKVYVFTDVSGSMRSSPITGNRDVASKIMAVNVAALISAAILRKNPTAEVIPFSDNISTVRLNPRDSIMTNTEKLSNIPSGGTNCSAPLAHLNAHNAKGDLCIMVSDNESWVDSNGRGYGPCAYQYGTRMLQEWNKFKARNPGAKLVCLDLTPNTSTQTINREDILNIGGFNDNVFEIIATFAKSGLGRHWTDVIDAIKL